MQIKVKPYAYSPCTLEYHLTEEEYEEVCEELKEEYYIKGCNTCRNDYDFFRMRV